MRRRNLLLAAAMAGCGGGRAPVSLPAAVDGWRRGAERDAQPPELLRKTVRRAITADYEGPGRATVAVFELSSPAAALDAAQRWRPEPDTVAFHRDNRFVTVHSPGTDRKALGAFIRALEKHFAR